MTARVSFVDDDEAAGWLHARRARIEADHAAQEEAEEIEEAIRSTPPHLLEAASRAPDNSRGLGATVGAAFRGPSGANLAADAAFDEPFSGLTPTASERIGQEIVDSFTQPQGWSVDSIVRRIEPIIRADGYPGPTRPKAELIARTESRAIASEAKLRLMLEEERTRGTEGAQLYRVRGARDHRTTRLSWWVRTQVGDGKPLDEVINVIERGIELAKAGAFLDGGELAGTPGEPIVLPSYFKRRGFVAHFNDRDTVTRVT